MAGEREWLRILEQNSTIRNHSRKTENGGAKAILFVIKYLKRAFLHLHFIGKLL